MRRPKSNTTKIQQKLTQTPQKKEGKVVFHWAVLAQTEFCLFSTITFSKNFRLTIEDMNCLLNRRPHIPTHHHTVPRKPTIFPSTASAASFFELHPQTDGLVFTIGGPAPLVRLWVPGLTQEIPKVFQRNSLGCIGIELKFQKVSSGVESVWQQESP